MLDRPENMKMVKLPFDKYEIKDLEKFLNEGVDTLYTTADAFYEGDHWQNGDGWIGPTPEATNGDRAIILSKIQQAFVSKNVIKEVCNRHAAAVLARMDASWRIVPKSVVDGNVVTTTVEQDTTVDATQSPNTDNPNDASNKQNTVDNPLIDEIVGPLKEWWKEREVSKVFSKGVNRLLYGGRAGVRVFIPQGLLDGGNVPTGLTFEQALSLIHVEDTKLEQARFIKDNATMEQAYIHVWKDKSVVDDKDYTYGEFSFVQPADGLTSINFLSDDPNIKKQTVIINLRRKNIYFEMERPPIITEQVISHQKAINMAFSMMSRNVVVGGFLERVVLSADLPGSYREVNGERKFVPDKLPVGPGVTTVLTPHVYEAEDGKMMISNPDIRYRDPVSVQTFTDTKRESYNAILEDVEQTHMIIAGDGFASGEARIQARANFATSLVDTKTEVDKCIKGLLETVIQIAATFSGNEETYKDLQVIASVKPDTGPLTPEEKRSLMEQYKSGLMSRNTAMLILGIDNIDEEIKKIETEKRITTPIELAAILTALSKTGWSLSYDQMPGVDSDILGLPPRDVNAYKKQLDEEAARQAPSGGNSGAVSDKAGVTNSPGSQSPGRTNNNDGEKSGTSNPTKLQ